MLLLADASPTRVFAVLTRSRTVVQLLDAAPTLDSDDACPAEVSRIPAPRLRRRVIISNEAGTKLAYAVSWWNTDEYARRMADAHAPIGASLATARLDVYRDMCAWYQGTCKDVAQALHVDAGSSMWGRHYVMYHDATPLAVICEVFSPTLCPFLGEYSTSTPPKLLGSAAATTTETTSATETQ